MNNKIKISLEQLQAVSELMPELTVKKYMEWRILLKKACEDQ